MKRLSMFVGFIVLIWLLAAIGACALQDKLLFHPDSEPLEVPPTGVDKITLYTADGETIYAFYRPAAHVDCPTIMFLHGNGGRIDFNLYRIERLAQFGLGAMLVEWRGYAGSSGTPSETGFHIDARTGWDWLVEDVGIPAKKIIVHGLSIGSGPAAKLARDVMPAALVLEAPYYSIRDLIKNKVPILPVSRILKHNFRTDLWIGDVNAPILFAHGAKDRLIPSSQSERLSQLAKQPWTRWISDEANHNNLTAYGLYEDAIMPFLEGHGLGCAK